MTGENANIFESIGAIQSNSRMIISGGSHGTRSVSIMKPNYTLNRDAVIEIQKYLSPLTVFGKPADE